jgi:hypothetical protein
MHSGTFSRPQGDALLSYRKIRSFPAFAGVNFSGNSDGFASSASSAALGPRNGGRCGAGILARRGDERKIVFVTAQPRPPAERIARVA